jgi:hypothetical protein
VVGTWFPKLLYALLLHIMCALLTQVPFTLVPVAGGTLALSIVHDATASY